MNNFAKLIVNWQKRAGRHGLPWQAADPYQIWLSEIMLQQTQVKTVIPYYKRFINTLPSIAALAHAPEDEVMQLWSGLGYYARARNLQRAAKQILEQHEGNFPTEFESILALPGVGRSTAAAISVFAFNKRHAILDGNVKRVLARHFGVEGDVKSKPVEARLWQLAQRELPTTSLKAYTQGLMDMGAVICTSRSPQCAQCPVNTTCVAFLEQRVNALPGKGETRTIPQRKVKMLILTAKGNVLLEKRAACGIWGGLWSLPEAPMAADVVQEVMQRWGMACRSASKLSMVKHAFTHYALTIYPYLLEVSQLRSTTNNPTLMWMALDQAHSTALPAPVKKMLIRLRQ